MWNQSNYDKRSHICRVECKAQNEFVFCEIWQIALGCSSLYSPQLLAIKKMIEVPKRRPCKNCSSKAGSTVAYF